MNKNESLKVSMVIYRPMQLGLCCLNTILRKDNVFCSRTVTRARFTVERAKELTLLNLKDAETMMRWNAQHGIYVFRLSSDLMPHFTDLEIESYTMDFAIPALKHLGDVARECKQRITMHPGQFNQVGAKSSSVFQKTVADLSYHAQILDYMGMDESSVLCIHGGGTYGDKEATIRRWKEQFSELPLSVRKRLAFENCERQYSTEDALDIASDCRIPFIFDTHHDACYRMLHPEYVADLEGQLSYVVETWREVKPLMHISEQKEGARIGAHSDYIETIPSYLFDLVKDGVSLDIEVEAKMKEQAIFQLYKKYPQLSKQI